jgi:hypothetical protein
MVLGLGLIFFADGEGAELGGIGCGFGAVCFILAGRIAGYLGKVDQGLGLGEAAWLEMGAWTSPAGVDGFES